MPTNPGAPTFPLFNGYYSFRVYLFTGKIEKIEYALSIGEGYLELLVPLALLVSDATIVPLVQYLVDDDETNLVDDDDVFLIEDPQYV